MAIKSGFGVEVVGTGGDLAKMIVVFELTYDIIV
jgi:hypothetical protein